MEAPQTSTDETRPGVMKRDGRLRRPLIGLVLATIGVVAIWILAAGTRQSAVRAVVQAKLQSVARAAAIYADQHGTKASLDDLFAAGLLERGFLDGFSRCEWGPGATVGLDLWLVQSTPCRAVRAGEAWGGPGETIDRDLPACRFVLLRDWTVLQLDEPEFQRAIAPFVRLAPVR